MFPFYSSFAQLAKPVLIDFVKEHLSEKFNEPEWKEWQKMIPNQHFVKWTDRDMKDFLHLLTRKIGIDQTLKKIKEPDYFHHHTYLEFTQRIKLLTSYIVEDSVWLWVEILTLEEFHLGRNNIQRTIQWFEDYVGKQETSILMQENLLFFLITVPRQLIHVENLLHEFCGISREDIKENIKNNPSFLRFIMTANYGSLKNVIALLTDDRGFHISQIRTMIQKYPDAFIIARDYYLESSIDILEKIPLTEQDTNKIIEQSFNTLVTNNITWDQLNDLIDFMMYNRFTMKSIKTMIKQNFYAFLDIAKLLIEVLEAKGFNKINIKYIMIQTFESLSYMNEDMVTHFRKSIELKEASMDKQRVESAVIEFMYNFDFATEEILTMLRQNPVAFFMFTKPLVEHLDDLQTFTKEEIKNILIDTFRQLAKNKSINELKDFMEIFKIPESKLFQRNYNCTASLVR